MPGRVDRKTRTGIYPIMPAGHLRLSDQVHRRLRQKVIGFPNVARPAASDDVLPRVVASLRARHYMVETFRRSPTVLATVAISSENRRPGQGHSPQVRNAHKPPKSDNRRNLDRDLLSMPKGVLGLDEVRFGAYDEHDRPPRSHNRQRFISRVQHQSSSQTKFP